MIYEAKISSKYQVTVPKAVVEQLSVGPSDKNVFDGCSGKIFLRTKVLTAAAAMSRMSKVYSCKPKTVEELNDAIGERLKREYK